jgi:hypothetical protein
MKPLCHHEYGSSISHYGEGWGIFVGSINSKEGETQRKMRVLYCCQYG